MSTFLDLHILEAALEKLHYRVTQKPFQLDGRKKKNMVLEIECVDLILDKTL